ncbi:protein FAM200A-like [Gigantopelta aegis]|uniref:protein FAM200A-like n=1 Tax=Gigantopelta aegis TaxID=1735272 RepID=UPI001B88A19E|nr:protein FAM200A-like [Gigantopelta aegis]
MNTLATFFVFTGMFCSLCIKHRQSSKGGTGNWTKVGCKTYREEAMKAHLNSTTHQVAMQLELELRATTSTGGIEASITLEQQAFMSSLQAMYWLVKNELPHTTNFGSLLQLLQDVGCKYLDSLNINKRTNYTSERTMQEMVVSIRTMLKNEKMEEIAASPFFSLLCDETTDITVAEQLITYIKYLDLDGRKTKVTFLGTDVVLSCGSDIITEKLIEVMDREGLAYLTKLAGFGSDGAANMVGRRNGVATQLKRGSSLDFDIIHAHVGATIEILEARLANPGSKFKKVLTGEIFEEMRESVPDWVLAVNTEKLVAFKVDVHDKFIKALVENIRGRFPDVGLLKALTILDPAKVPEDLDELHDYGDDMLQSPCFDVLVQWDGGNEVNVVHTSDLELVD